MVNYSVIQLFVLLLISAESNNESINEAHLKKNGTSTDLARQLDTLVSPAKLAVNSLKNYFDVALRHTKRESVFGIQFNIANFPWLIIFCSSIGVIIMICLLALLICGLTADGKRKFKRLYFQYYGKPEEYEKGWRYSFFRDHGTDGKNYLFDAVQEANKTKMLNALNKGVYVNAYNEFGNTALHEVTERGYPELVEILIKHGSDRSLLNVQNRTPEQMIKENYPGNAKLSEKIRRIYAKYQNQTFKPCMPEVVPVSSFHIWIDERIDHDLATSFLQHFRAIVTVVQMITTTHCVLKTDEDGVAELDSLQLLLWIFTGPIVVKEAWLKDCVNDHKIIEQDGEYLVEKVRFRGKVFNTVIQWSNAMAKGEIPYLYGVVVSPSLRDYEYLYYLTAIVISQGGTILEHMPVRRDYNNGSRPYLHVNLGPLFIISDGLTDFMAYEADPDKMYHIISEEEFIWFLLERKINRDTSPNPIPLLKAKAHK